MDQQFEKMLSKLSDMEMISPCDRLSKLIEQIADTDDSELDEYDLEFVSAAELQPYQKFLKRLGK